MHITCQLLELSSDVSPLSWNKSTHPAQEVVTDLKHTTLRTVKRPTLSYLDENVSVSLYLRTYLFIQCVPNQSYRPYGFNPKLHKYMCDYIYE